MEWAKTSTILRLLLERWVAVRQLLWILAGQFYFTSARDVIWHPFHVALVSQRAYINRCLSCAILRLLICLLWELAVDAQRLKDENMLRFNIKYYSAQFIYSRSSHTMPFQNHLMFRQFKIKLNSFKWNSNGKIAETSIIVNMIEFF